MKENIIFDLDGTLISTDCTKKWLIKQLKSNIFRYFGALLVIPIAIPCMKSKKYRSVGVGLFVWLATYRCDESQLKVSFADFAFAVKSNTVPELYWLSDAISVLEQHIKEHQNIIVVTAAAELLAQALIESLNLTAHVTVIGTPLNRKWGGWVGGQHCRHQEKVRRLHAIGIPSPWYATYTDDPKEDYPLLINSKYKFLINVQQPDDMMKELNRLHYLIWR